MSNSAVSPSGRFHGLDTLRSLALLVVMTTHFWGLGGRRVLPEWVGPITKSGWMAVDLFFVLSGYLIGAQLLREYARGKQPGLWQFYRARLYRILPVYLVVLAAYYWIPNWPEFPTTMTTPWRFLTFTFNLFLPYDHDNFSHVWSLCVEEHFYLLLPLIVLASMRKPSLRKAVLLFTGILLFGIAIRGYFLIHALQPAAHAGASWGRLYIVHIYYPTYSRLDGLLDGVALAAIQIFRPTWWQRIAQRGHAFTFSAIGLVALTVWITHDRFKFVTGAAAVGVVLGFPILSLGLTCLVASSLSNNGFLNRWKVPGARLTAILAYPIYLPSKALIHIVDMCFPHLAQASKGGYVAVYLVFCLVTAGVLHLCVERPFLRLRDRQKLIPSAVADLTVPERLGTLSRSEVPQE